MPKRRTRDDKPIKRWQGKKCPLCGAHLRENEVLDRKSGVVVAFVDCPKCEYWEYLDD